MDSRIILFLISSPIYGGFVYLSSPRWALGVSGHPRGTPPESHGTLRNGEMAELRIESVILGIRSSAFCFSSPPIYGGFVFFAFPRWALGVKGRPCKTSPGAHRNSTERYVAVEWRNCEYGPEF